jgi:hypothetical protein
MGKITLEIEVKDLEKTNLIDHFLHEVSVKLSDGFVEGEINDVLRNGEKKGTHVRGYWSMRYLEDKDNPNLFPFKPNTAYYMRDKISGTGYHVIGINKVLNRICVAGHPKQMLHLTDCENFEERGKLIEMELEFRKKHFGTNWI